MNLTTDHLCSTRKDAFSFVCSSVYRRRGVEDWSTLTVDPHPEAHPSAPRTMTCLFFRPWPNWSAPQTMSHLTHLIPWANLHPNWGQSRMITGKRGHDRYCLLMLMGGCFVDMRIYVLDYTQYPLKISSFRSICSGSWNCAFHPKMVYISDMCIININITRKKTRNYTLNNHVTQQLTVNKTICSVS